jgi:phosphonate transport system substrate-binding protein
MRLITRIGATAAAVALAASLSGCGNGDDAGAAGDADDNTLRMGVVPTDSATETFNQWSFLIDLIEEDTGYQIELFEATDLPAVIEATIAGDLDIIHLGPFGQLLARQNGAEIATVGATAPTSAGVDNASVGVVRDDSPVTELADLEGEDICFVSPSSATGYLFAAAGFIEEGIDPEIDINPIFVGDHSSATRSMYDGECAAVFTTRSQAEKEFYENNPDVQPGELRAFWSEEVPEGGISISTNLPQDVQDTLRTTLLELNGTAILADDRCSDDRIFEDEDGNSFCGAWVNYWWGLEEADDTYWEPVRVVCEATEAPACVS